MTLESIMAAAEGLKAASNLAKTFVGLKGKAEIQAKTVELQNIILAAQSNALAAQGEQAMMLQRIRELEEEVARVEAWEAEKQRYKMHQPTAGVITYILKEDAGGTEPPHQICANCYDTKHTKSILQQETRYPGRTLHLVCHNCGNDVILFGGRQR